MQYSVMQHISYTKSLSLWKTYWTDVTVQENWMNNLSHTRRKYKTTYCTFIAKKLSPLSLAKAFATIVLEHPGGPYRRIPLGGSIPILVKDSGCFNGHSTACFNFSFTFSIPPISDQRTCGGNESILHWYVKVFNLQNSEHTAEVTSQVQ